MEAIRTTVQGCCLVVLTIPLILACSKPSATITELRHYPVDDLEGLINRSNVRLDEAISNDGNGSLRISVEKPTTIRLYETGDIDSENSRLLYQAHVRTENIEGQLYLEMWCHFRDKGEFFSRGLQNPLKGTNNWTNQEIPFFLKKGENPDNVKLNLVIDGRGTAWIDEIRLLEAPLD